jgi:CRISPR-associated protein Cst2
MYLSVNIISAPLLAANNRGENQGNISTLQKIESDMGTRTTLSGYAIARDIRHTMQVKGAKVWRGIVDRNADNLTGYVYQKPDGSGTSVEMASAVPASADLFDDTLAFGYMIAAKGSKDEDAFASTSNVELTTAISTTEWKGDTVFIQGQKAAGQKSSDDKKAAGQKSSDDKTPRPPTFAPAAQERHFTRYQFLLSANLTALKPRPNCITHVLEALKSIQAGGNHARNASALVPEVMVWRFHQEPGLGGLYLCGGLNHSPEAPVDLGKITNHLAYYGINDARIVSPGSDMNIADAIASMIADAKMYQEG